MRHASSRGGSGAYEPMPVILAQHGEGPARSRGTRRRGAFACLAGSLDGRSPRRGWHQCSPSRHHARPPQSGGQRAMVTTIVDLEAIRAHLHAEAARIRSEYETVLPDIEGDLAAVDRLLSRMPALAVAEPALEVTVETEFAARTARQPNWK